jgi:hypothetical protein
MLLKMKNKKVKQVLLGWEPVGRKRVKREDKRWRVQWMHFVYVYENRTMKSVEIVHRKG